LKTTHNALFPTAGFAEQGHEVPLLPRYGLALYVALAERPAADSQEVAPGIVLDFDAVGRLVGIDIDRASQTVDLARLEAAGLPLRRLLLAPP
jgi:uncharacterized protein YuzE